MKYLPLFAIILMTSVFFTACTKENIIETEDQTEDSSLVQGFLDYNLKNTVEINLNGQSVLQSTGIGVICESEDYRLTLISNSNSLELIVDEALIMEDAALADILAENEFLLYNLESFDADFSFTLAFFKLEDGGELKGQASLCLEEDCYNEEKLKLNIDVQSEELIGGNLIGIDDNTEESFEFVFSIDNIDTSHCE